MGVVTGIFQYANGSPVANGSYQWKLNSDAVEISTSCIVPTIVRGTLDPSGNLTTTFAFNDVLSTTGGANTCYQLTVKDAGGGQCWNEFYFLTGTAANLTLIPPVGTGCPGQSASQTVLVLETNGVYNSNQALLNLQQGSGITLTNVAGTTTIVASSTALLLETNAATNSSQTLLNLVNGNNITMTNAAGATTINAAGTGFLPAAQLGDTIRWNVNGDTAWDAVNYVSKMSVIAPFGGSLVQYGAHGAGSFNVTGTGAVINPTTIDSPATSASSGATASAQTVIGATESSPANSGQGGFQAFYRWTHRWAAGNTSSVRYYMGITQLLSGSYGPPVSGSTAFATDTPNQPFVGFRFSATTDTAWQAVTVKNTSGNTTVSTTAIAIDTNIHNFEILWNGTAYLFWIDNSQVASISTNLPTPTASGTIMFWSGDNKNSATAISGNFYHMMQSLK